MKRKLVTALFLFLGVSLWTLPFFATQVSKPAPCVAPEYHQFDFWLGDWDTFDFGSTTKNARVRVATILEGCVIHEDYQSVDGVKGESFSIYDSTRRRWHQTWVTNLGRLLTIEGSFEPNQITLSGTDLTDAGQQRTVRGVWKPLPDGSVRETARTSLDGGKTWQPWFDLVFRPHKE